MRYMFCIKVDTIRRKNQSECESVVFDVGCPYFDWNTKQAKIGNASFLEVVRTFYRSESIYESRKGVVSYMRNMYYDCVKNVC